MRIHSALILGVLIGACPAFGFGNPIRLAAAEQIRMGGPSYQTAVADFNGDGVDDFASPILTETGSTYTTVLRAVLNTNGGGPRSEVDTTITLGGRFVASDDFDSDGKADIVVGNGEFLGPGHLAVHRGNGDGSFQPPWIRTGFLFMCRLTTGDFNNDGKSDLVVATETEILLFSGNGDGTFDDPVPTYVAVGMFGMAVEDLNGDGTKDLFAVSRAGTAVVLHGGSSGFVVHQNFAIGIRAVDTALTDWNGDGYLDAAIAGDNGDAMLALGVSGGSFASPQTFSGGKFNCTVAGDFDLDGHPDIAIGHVASANYDEHVIVHYGDGTGNISRTKHYCAGAVIRQLAMGDFNDDGSPDLLCVNNRFTYSLMHGLGSEGFLAMEWRAEGSSICATDFDQDGKADMCVSNGEHIRLWLGDGTSAFTGGIPFDTSTPRQVVTGDFDGNGRPDVFYCGSPWPMFRELRTGPGGSLTLAQAFNPPAFDEPNVMSASDFNGDGYSDVAITDVRLNKIFIYVGSPTGLMYSATYATGVFPGRPHACDYDNDGDMDLVVPNRQSAYLTILAGRGDGIFDSTASLALTSPASNVSSANFDSDAILDLVVLTTTPLIYAGTGGGTFVKRTSLQIPRSYEVNFVRCNDLNNDGFADIVLASDEDDCIDVFQAGAGGNFAHVATYAAGPGQLEMDFADFNGDGLPDIAVAGSTACMLSIPPLQPDLAILPVSLPETAYVGATTSYEFLLTNHGDAEALNVACSVDFSDKLSVTSVAAPGMLAEIDGSSVTLRIASLAPESSISVTIVVQGEQAGTAEITAAVGTDSDDADPSNNELSAQTSVFDNLNMAWNSQFVIQKRTVRGKLTYRSRLALRMPSDPSFASPRNGNVSYRLSKDEFLSPDDQPIYESKLKRLAPDKAIRKTETYRPTGNDQESFLSGQFVIAVLVHNATEHAVAYTTIP